jgi:hypothetical protein
LHILNVFPFPWQVNGTLPEFQHWIIFCQSSVCVCHCLLTACVVMSIMPVCFFVNNWFLSCAGI